MSLPTLGFQLLEYFGCRQLLTIVCVVSYPSSLRRTKWWWYCYSRYGQPEVEDARGLTLLLLSTRMGTLVPELVSWWCPNSKIIFNHEGCLSTQQGLTTCPVEQVENKTRVTQIFPFWSLCPLFPNSYVQSQLLLGHHTHRTNCLLGISMWMSTKHLKLNV